MYHSGIVLAHALMSAGTTSDAFLRDNLEWLSRATNWAKFSATATLGVIHKGHVKQALQLLQPYLPQAGMSASAYSEGGALFALGIIHANHGTEIRSYLLDALRNAGTNEVVQHGAALGIGIAAMGTEDDALYEELKGVLFNDSAVAGEAAAIAMGLTMLGSASGKAVEEMLGYAHDTQHEKIIRGLSLALAMTMYAREEEAEALITTLLHDKDAILRYGAVHTVAFAYACTGSNAALRRLLHVAVSDVSDDVRRAAVTAIGFVLAGTPAQTPKVVKLLAESYNPHVRYGATMAVGISCAGTGLREAIDLLTPMLSDSVDIVRQGALIGMSMVLMQSTDHKEEGKLAEHRKLLAKVVSDKHEDTMAKMGAIIAAGLLDAGGRNVGISLVSKTGHRMASAIVGMGVFTHFWFWHPLALFASLALQPTAAIGVNHNLQLPKWRFRSNAPPSAFAYPPPSDKKKEDGPALGPAAVLSTSGKKKNLIARQLSKGGAAAMEVEKAEQEAEKKKEAEEKAAADAAAAEKARDEIVAALPALHKAGALTAEVYEKIAKAPPPAEKDAKASESSSSMEAEGPKPALGELLAELKAAHDGGDVTTATYLGLLAKKPKVDGEAAEAEPEFEVLESPARVLRAQEGSVALLAGSRYVPIIKGRHAGFIVLKDLTPDEEEVLLTPTATSLPADAADTFIPEPPAPFEFTEAMVSGAAGADAAAPAAAEGDETGAPAPATE